MTFRQSIEIHAGDLSDFSDGELGLALGEAVMLAYAALPDSLILEVGFEPSVLYDTNQGLDVSDKVVLYVVRYNATGQKKTCLEVSPLLFDDYSDTNSIYEATKEDPVYTIKKTDGVPTLVVAPQVTGTGTTDGSNNTASIFYSGNRQNYQDELDETSITTINSKLYRWIKLTASMFVLGYKLRDAVLEEEDSELVQLLQSQMQLIKGQIDAEQSRLFKQESTAMDNQSFEQTENPTRGKPTMR
tara:strand:- start:26121 stop:26852 length:732 start_codon:yes stop_codon:yes gene_type:complete